MDRDNLEIVRETSQPELPIKVLALTGKMMNQSQKGISPSKENSMLMAKKMITNFKEIKRMIPQTKDYGVNFLHQEEFKNINAFLGIKPTDFKRFAALETIAAKKFKRFLDGFKDSQFVEVSVDNNDLVENGWYAFRDDTNVMEGFYSTAPHGRVNLINKDGHTKYVGLAQVSISNPLN